MNDQPRDISERPFAQAPVAQRREDVRIAVTLPVLVNVAARDMTIRLHTAEISGGGLLLAGAEMLSIDEQLRFALSTNRRGKTAREDPPIVGTGTVTRIDQRGHRAIRFDSIADIDRRRLVRLVFERQRIDRRDARGRA